MFGRLSRYTALCLLLTLAVQSTVTGAVGFLMSRPHAPSGQTVVAVLDVCGHSNQASPENAADVHYIPPVYAIGFHPSTTSYPADPAGAFRPAVIPSPEEPPEA